MKKKKLYKISKDINWRRQAGCLMVLDPKSKRLLFYNKKISAYVSNEGVITENHITSVIIKYLLSINTIRNNNSVSASNLDYSIKKISAPLNVTVQITNRCNLNCIHCHRSLKNTKDLDFGTFKRVVRELRGTNVFNINISGGEPTLVAKLAEMISFVDKIGMKVTISTNGVLLNKKLIKKYSRAGLKNLQLSLDSCNPEKHDSIRGVGGAFKGLMKCAQLLKQLKVNFTIVTTIINQTPKEYEAVIDLAYRLGAAAHKTNTVIPQGEGGKLKQGALSIKKYKSVWIKGRKKYKGKMLVLAETMFAIQLGRKFIAPSDAPEVLRIGCPAGVLTANINEYGDVNPCPFFSDLVVGNIYKNSFEEIWENSEDLNTIRNRDKIRVCGRCINKKVCGGCRARSYGAAKDLSSGDSSCFRFS